ncbi:peptidase M28 [alpha proteobacterium AAP81b]|nr:peptidase M28 [alpha proteobacterium AAP81b]
MKLRLAAAALLLATPALAGPDSDTKAWWALTTQLSDDSMAGRDTGSPEHARAVALVVARFQAAKLQPAGDNGGWIQTLALKEVKIEAAGTTITIVAPDGSATPLKFLHDIAPTAARGLPAIDAPLRFAGYCGKAEVAGLAGKVAVCFGNRRPGAPLAGERLANVTAAGAVALITIADPGFSLEPPRWPVAYARSVSFAAAAEPRALPQFSLNADALPAMMAGTGRLPAALITDGGFQRPLDSFDLPGRFRATLALSERTYTSDSVLARLPGTDPALAKQAVLLSAHIDGYGTGEPVKGDAIYNGTYDNAAYVATLVRLAERRGGRGYRRPLVFAAFTGEEKGLLGARWFVRQPTVPLADLAAVINLDQLRPIFPLRALTMHGLTTSTLGATATEVARAMKIAIRPDREPERNLNQRTDHWPFLEAGVPATSFVFAYDPRSPEERIYRDWAIRFYHRPQDDPKQPIDFKAARDFNRFFEKLVESVADGATRPKMLAPAK